MAFKDGRHIATSKEFVRFLVGEGWLAHYLDFAGERMLPSIPKLLDAPFWLDPTDPHRMAAVMQVASRPMQYDYETVSGNWRYSRVWQENVWGKAIHRVAAEGISPEQAVDEAIARIKQILKRVGGGRKLNLLAATGKMVRATQVCLWLEAALRSLASARPQHGSDRTFGRVSTAVGRRADLPWAASIGRS